MSGPIPLDIQALAVECAACNQRAAVDRHEELASRRKWNGDLLPAERRLANELAAAAQTMRELAGAKQGQPVLFPGVISLGEAAEAVVTGLDHRRHKDGD